MLRKRGYAHRERELPQRLILVMQAQALYPTIFGSDLLKDLRASVAAQEDAGTSPSKRMNLPVRRMAKAAPRKRTGA
jgi:hypothetical protein